MSQFGHPRGIPGRMAGWVMAHRGSNRRRNRWAVSLLDVQPTDRVLEIGFGPGVAIAELANRAIRGQVYGIDHSEVMLQQASRRNAAAIRAHRVHLVHASVDQLPSFDDPLDAILAVNSVGIWPNPAERLHELRRLLRPDGRIALASQPRCPGATDQATVRAAQQLQDLLTQAGFIQIRTETLDLDPPVACVLAINPADGWAPRLLQPVRMGAFDAVAGVATTGFDEIDETRASNRQLAELMATIPPVNVVDDPVKIREDRARGAGPFPAPVRLDQAVNRTIPGRAGDIPIRVFTPEVVRGVFLHLHGGGWTLGSAANQDPFLAALAHDAGVAVVSVEYRLAPEHPYPAGPDDCEDAAAWLVASAQREFGTDRLVIGGESAGAHLAVCTLLRLRDRRGITGAFRAAQLIFGAYDLSMSPSTRRWGDRNLGLSVPVIAWFNDQFVPGRSPEQRRDPDISPLYADLSGMPPARFVVGTQDPLLDDSLFMAARWRSAGSPAVLEVVAEAVHGFVLYPIAVAQQELARGLAYVAAAVRNEASDKFSVVDDPER
jgi:acetyl esterase/lipase/SAM-dependent methyltransferase